MGETHHDFDGFHLRDPTHPTPDITPRPAPVGARHAREIVGVVWMPLTAPGRMIEWPVTPPRDYRKQTGACRPTTSA